ncbi:hypothetical protein ambt_06385 [Alteromonas naphthalenivorans]|uniref:Uncharacterized protein n=1 Tax=Alteromonas naphthalenivorans TaxID=715451 RepID=F5ZCR5_ALTNA|nr:hypothetical protein ambt_06385 [Alteromonas naphthalenivorans]
MNYQVQWRLLASNKNLAIKRILRNLLSTRGNIKTTNALAMIETTGEGSCTVFLLNQ